MSGPWEAEESPGLMSLGDGSEGARAETNGKGDWDCFEEMKEGHG